MVPAVTPVLTVATLHLATAVMPTMAIECREQCILCNWLVSKYLQVLAWPFVVGSFAFGYFALGPFFALWTPMADEAHKQTGPPKKRDLVSSCSSCVPK